MGRAASRLRSFVAAAVASTAASAVEAHPHVLPTVQTDVIFRSDGRVTAIRHAWTYDSAYSTFAARDIDIDKDGTISKEELEAFAGRQIEVLAEHSYFTTVHTQADSLGFGPTQSYGVEKLDDGRLRLTFTAPLKTAAAVDRKIVIELHDPNFFAYFTLANDGVQLLGAPESCKTSVAGPQPIDLRNTRSIPAIFWQALDGSKSAASQFVNRITVTCP